MTDILSITEGLSFDDSFQEYQVHEYEPQTGASLNSSGAEIRINIETQDLFVHPAESYLLVEERLLKNNDTAYAVADLVSLVNNYPGIATNILGLLTYPDDFSKPRGLNQLWYKDSTTDAELKALVLQLYMVKLPQILQPKECSHSSYPYIFGFAEDYDNIVYGFKHELTLVRDSDANAVLRAAAADAAKIVLRKLSWFVPHVVSSNENKMKLSKTIHLVIIC